MLNLHRICDIIIRFFAPENMKIFRCHFKSDPYQWKCPEMADAGKVQQVLKDRQEAWICTQCNTIEAV